MIDARRSRLPDTQGGDNPGLLLSRYLAIVGDKGKESRELYNTVASTPASDVYLQAFKRWEAMQTARQPCAVITTETLAAPLAIGLGSASPTEVGLTTSQPYGMPVIPGSALKGVCRAGATQLRANGLLNDPAFNILFGDHKSASHFVFWDAWYDPASADGKPFHPDTITVHHPDYYARRGAGGAWPTDFDDPTPVPFLVVRPGAQFFFALDAPTPEWGAFALNLLRWSLAHVGVGGKTNAGYGYFAAQGTQFQDSLQAQRSAVLGQPEVKEWAGATILYNPGKNSLLEAISGAEKARVDGQSARDLIASLPELAAASLKGKKKQLDGATVQVKVDGNSRLIIGITLPPT